MSDLLLKTNGRGEEDYDVISESRLVGHIFKPTAAPVETPWMWAFVHSRPEDRFPAPHGYAATRVGDAGFRKRLVRVKLATAFATQLLGTGRNWVARALAAGAVRARKH
jgi:hypothetical protein